MKIYHGRLSPDGRCIVEVWDDVAGSGRSLDPCLWIRNHSPDGFEWGYGGSGPAQLALAILYDLYRDRDIAERYYQRFKFLVVGRFDSDTWLLTEFVIRAYVELLAGELVVPMTTPEDHEG